MANTKSGPHAGRALLAVLLASTPAVAAPPRATLVELSSTSAVLEIGGRLAVVRVGDRVPGIAARIVHVDAKRMLVEFASSATSRGGIVEVTRGQALSWPQTEPTSRRSSAVSAELLETEPKDD